MIGSAVPMIVGYVMFVATGRSPADLNTKYAAAFIVVRFTLLRLLSLSPASCFIFPPQLTTTNTHHHSQAIGAFQFGAMCTSVVAINSTSDTSKASALGTVVFAGNLGGLVATWVFLPEYVLYLIAFGFLNFRADDACFV